MKVFLLGVGAQKAGTTWLHDYLAAAPESDFGFMKEYHVFDALTLPSCINFRSRIARSAIKAMKRSDGNWISDPAMRRALFLVEPENYFDYFAGLLTQDDIKLTGDITPAYAGLSEETLHQIKDGFKRRGITVRPVFLMRDPVDRLQSMVRMNFRDRKINPTCAQEQHKMSLNLKSPGDRIRSDYTRIISALDNVFGIDAFFEFYERLFFESSIRRLCDHLGVAYRETDLTVCKNVSRTDNALHAEDREKFARAYHKVYSFCGHRFGGGLIDMIWKTPNSDINWRANQDVSKARL